MRFTMRFTGSCGQLAAAASCKDNPTVFWRCSAYRAGGSHCGNYYNATVETVTVVKKAAEAHAG